MRAQARAVQHTYALWMDVAALGLRQLAGLRVLAVVDERDTGRVLGLLGLGRGGDALRVGTVHLRVLRALKPQPDRCVKLSHN